MAEDSEAERTIMSWKIKKDIKFLKSARGNGKEKKLTKDCKPLKPIIASLYRCDNKFHTQDLNELLESDNKYGFIVMDGHGTLFGTLSGNVREVLHNFTVDRPNKHDRGQNKHGRGRQSEPRFFRLRIEKRHNYVHKIAELATQYYINPATSKPNIAGLILAGSADLKTELSQSDMFDKRLQPKILKVVNVSCGGLDGFNQAIKLSSDILSNVKFIQQKRLLGKYFDEINHDTGKYVSGIDDTINALEMGVVQTLIISENLDITRFVLKNNVTGEIFLKHLNKDQKTNKSNFRDPDTDAALEVKEEVSFLDWITEEYNGFGCSLELVSHTYEEGFKFRSFGGVGGILRYQVDIRSFDESSDHEFS